jgi:Cdc6-like AAA superfamily ATPase
VSNYLFEEGKFERLALVAEAFTPSAPVDTLLLFAGRLTQFQDVVTATAQKGQHVALYGERGVGKTSLANVLAAFYRVNRASERDAAKVNCGTEDTFSSLWANIFRELGEPQSAQSPEDVRYHLARLDRPAIIVIDELDRLEDNESLSLLADTVKTLSDHAISSTLVLVGVADSIDGLIGEHRSVERALVQIELPRMSHGELAAIIDKGCDHARLEIVPEARRRIATLSEGLPHFTHLLALHAGQGAVNDDRDEITLGDVVNAIDASVEKHSIRSEYQTATRSPKPDNLFCEVLTGCALARKDQLGYFSAGAVREPLAKMGKPLEIPAYARHLKQFTEDARGPVLQKVGEPRRFFYRFANPLLEPYVILDAISKGLITHELLSELRPDDRSSDWTSALRQPG